MKKIILAILLLSVSNVMASQSNNIIFKCVDSKGEISYVNGSQSKSHDCTKTELADVDKFDTVSTNEPRKNINTVSSKNMVTTDGEVVSNEEQKLRETKRELVLKNELNDEREQLTSVNAMLKKVTTKDSAQDSLLKNMQNTHLQNIASLEKELGLNQPKKLTIVSTKK